MKSDEKGKDKQSSGSVFDANSKLKQTVNLKENVGGIKYKGKKYNCGIGTSYRFEALNNEKKSTSQSL